MPRRVPARSRLPMRGAADALSCSRFAGRVVVPARYVLYATDVSDVPGAAAWPGVSDRVADGVRDACRCSALGCLGAFARAPVLQPGALVAGSAGVADRGADHRAADRSRDATDGRDR